jgi:hypothetical protein
MGIIFYFFIINSDRINDEPKGGERWRLRKEMNKSWKGRTTKKNILRKLAKLLKVDLNFKSHKNRLIRQVDIIVVFHWRWNAKYSST